MRHVILGAGKFSHAHIRVLTELGINSVDVCKRSDWTNDQRSAFMQRHPTQSLAFHDNINDDLLRDSTLHVVTPSDQHLRNLLDTYQHAAVLFVEKPAVLLTNDTSCEQANLLKTHCKIPIYHDDWLAGLYDHIPRKSRPTHIRFSYDVVNADTTLDLMSEIASHGCNLLSCWVSPSEQMAVISKTQSIDNLQMSLEFSRNLRIDLAVSCGKVARSTWQCSIDDADFSSLSMGGQLLTETVSRVINGSPALTDWYDASWLISKLCMHDDQLRFESLFNQWYGA
jgi:hypothetical protein